MSTEQQLTEIMQTLRSLPADKVAVVRDFVLNLNQTAGVDYSGEWTDEDLRDFTRASWEYADEVVPWDPPRDEANGAENR